jgi:hypothetical protein
MRFESKSGARKGLRGLVTDEICLNVRVTDMEPGFLR